MQTGYVGKRGASLYTSRSTRTIDRARATGELPYYKPSTRSVLFKVSDLDMWMSKSRVDVSEVAE